MHSLLYFKVCKLDYFQLNLKGIYFDTPYTEDIYFYYFCKPRENYVYLLKKLQGQGFNIEFLPS